MRDIIHAAQQSIWLVIVLSAWPVIVATLIGLIVGAFQTVLQLQEQTLPFGVKLVGVGFCLYAGAGWAGHRLLLFAVELMRYALTPLVAR